MEQNTKTILWVVAFITLPITIPLAIISFGIVASVFFLVLGFFVIYPHYLLIAILSIVIVWYIDRYE